MTEHISVESGPPSTVLASIRKLFPPDFLVHIGAGAGNGLLATWREWDVSNALVIDAAPQNLAWVAEAARGRRWRACNAVLMSYVGKARWVEVDNAEESGVLTPSQLSSVADSWCIQREYECAVTNLDALIVGEPYDYQQAWLVIECFPTVPILEGSARVLARTSVIWLRVVISESACEAMSLAEVESYLTERGFVLVDITRNDSSALGFALFVRNRIPDLLNEIAELKLKSLETEEKLEASELRLDACLKAEQQVKQLTLELQRSELLRQGLEEQVTLAAEQLRLIEELLLKEGK